MEVRRVEPGGEALWAKAAAAFGRENNQAPLISMNDLNSAVQDPRCYLFLALSEGEPLGLLSAYRVPDVVSGGQLVYLYDIVVHSQHRRRGIGAALVDALLPACQADGAGLVWAGTALDNVAAHRLFERSGAALVSETYAEYEWRLGR